MIASDEIFRKRIAIEMFEFDGACNNDRRESTSRHFSDWFFDRGNRNPAWRWAENPVCIARNCRWWWRIVCIHNAMKSRWSMHRCIPRDDERVPQATSEDMPTTYALIECDSTLVFDNYTWSNRINQVWPNPQHACLRCSPLLVTDVLVSRIERSNPLFVVLYLRNSNTDLFRKPPWSNSRNTLVDIWTRSDSAILRGIKQTVTGLRLRSILTLDELWLLSSIPFAHSCRRRNERIEVGKRHRELTKGKYSCTKYRKDALLVCDDRPPHWRYSQLPFESTEERWSIAAADEEHESERLAERNNRTWSYEHNNSSRRTNGQSKRIGHS